MNEGTQVADGSAVHVRRAMTIDPVPAVLQARPALHVYPVGYYWFVCRDASVPCTAKTCVTC